MDTWFEWLNLILRVVFIATCAYMVGLANGRARENQRLKPHRWTSGRAGFPQGESRCTCLSNWPTCGSETAR